MLDEDLVRQHLASVRAELARLDQEREAYLNLIKGDEAILRLRGSTPDLQLHLSVVETKSTSAEPANGAISFRGAMKRVLQEARGEPLHSKEILRRVLEMGATTNAQDPQAVTDLMGYSLKKSGYVEKIAPRTWRWIGRETD